MSSHNPTHGQKVTLGKDAPVSQEGSGPVASDSLAAESSAFKSSNHAEAHKIAHEDLRSATRPHEGSLKSENAQHGTGATAHKVDAAPTYVTNQALNDGSGPHGKNITEDDDMTWDRSKNASFNEYGTTKDPGALAEKKFGLGQGAGSGSKGERQTAIDGETPYAALNREEEA